MGKTIRVSLLVLLLSCSAQAGIMPNDAPQPPSQSAYSSEEGEPAEEDDTPDDAADILAEAALSLFNDMLALL